MTPSSIGLLIHTNHSFDPSAAVGDRAPRVGPDNYLRHDVLLRALYGRTPGGREALREVMASHAGGSGAVCCHPDPKARSAIAGRRWRPRRSTCTRASCGCGATVRATSRRNGGRRVEWRRSTRCDGGRRPWHRRTRHSVAPCRERPCIAPVAEVHTRPQNYGDNMSTPWPKSPPTRDELAAFADAEPRPFWAASAQPQDPAAALRGQATADLCIVGAGFTGLWAALHAKADQPDRDVVVLEAQTAGFGASSRNGGFLEASLTHGLLNGLSRFGDEMAVLERLAHDNFVGLQADLAARGIACDFEPTGMLSVALEPYQAAEIAGAATMLRQYGHDVETFDDPDAIRAQLNSPLFRAGLWIKDGAALVDPGKLAAALRQAVLAAGVRLYEHSAVAAVVPRDDRLDVVAAQGRVRASRVLLATSAYPGLVRSIRRRVLPVYDYVLMTEPLTPEQKRSIGWSNRQGVADQANQFHYFRLTSDDRILWGGYDAVYRYGGPVGAQLDDSARTFGRLSQHFFMAFPQLRGLRFSHRWGGAIDTCSRFSVFFGTEHGGRLSYAVGYTGLGVGATRFGARVALDLLDGWETEATRLDFVRRKPMAFPPEPARTAVVQLTRNRLAAADEDGGRRGLWLRTLDRLGLGFDS